MSKKNRPRILLTNDDGVNARGIRVFADILKEYGDVTVVAPQGAQSGMSAALSMEQPLYLKHIREEKGIDWWSFSGTPVSCVKLAMNDIFCDESEDLPDFVFSGINIGANCSAATLYSGTLGACVEGTLYGVPSIGFSICTHDETCDLSGVELYGRRILDRLFSGEFKPAGGVYLNINFPHCPAGEIKGIRASRMGLGRWINEYDRREDEEHGKHFWMAGAFMDMEKDNALGDHNLTRNHFISIVPLSIDYTAYGEIGRITETFEKIGKVALEK